MRLEAYLRDQRALQLLLGEPMGRGEEAMKENILALIVEASELLNELNWKVWKQKTKPIDRDKILGELADIMKFYCNLLNIVGVTEEEFDTTWRATEHKVKTRYHNGY